MFTRKDLAEAVTYIIIIGLGTGLTSYLFLTFMSGI